MGYESQQQTTEPFAGLQLAWSNDRLLIATTRTRTLLALPVDGNHSQAAIIQRFTAGEWSLLLPLLQSYPVVVSYDRLLAARHAIPLGQGRKQVQAAQHNGHLRETLRPLRDTISRLRPKLKAFSLDIATRQGNGYILIVQTNSLTSGEI